MVLTPRVVFDFFFNPVRAVSLVLINVITVILTPIVLVWSLVVSVIKKCKGYSNTDTGNFGWKLYNLYVRFGLDQANPFSG